MEFVRRFEEHQVERIRRAMIAYRSRHKVGDVTLAKKLLSYLSANATYDSTLKNIQKLRKGEHMRGAVFLNACVRFLEVEMVTPPEEELGLAMRYFIASPFGSADLWADLEGDYVLRVAGERNLAFSATVIRTDIPLATVAATSNRVQPLPDRPVVVLSIGTGEGKDYGVARERQFFFNEDEPAADDEAESPAVSALERRGVCLPIGNQDLLIMIRDFLFSHMYVLKRETFGFAGTMIKPSISDFFAEGKPAAGRQSHYNVALQRVPWK